MSLSRRMMSQMLTAGWLGAAGLLALYVAQQGAAAVPGAASVYQAASEPPAARPDPVAPNATPSVWWPGRASSTEVPLRLALLGTIASTDPSLSHATLHDLERDERLVVGVGERIRERALVVWIERDRVVLRENGAIRELALDAASQLARVGVRERAENEEWLVDAYAREHQSLNAELDGAHVIPVLEQERMVGLEFGLIQYGTRFAEIGLQTGDVITELDGLPVDSPAMSAEVLAALSEADAFRAVGYGADGSARVWSASSDG